jgi:hypothetical protein
MRLPWQRARQSATRHRVLCPQCAQIDLTSLLFDPKRISAPLKSPRRISAAVTAGGNPQRLHEDKKAWPDPPFVDDLTKKYDMGLVTRIARKAEKCLLCHLFLSVLLRGSFDMDTNTDQRTLIVGISKLGYFNLGASQAVTERLYTLSLDTHPGSLKKLHLSRTIRDAINLVRLIGEQYIWIPTNSK